MPATLHELVKLHEALKRDRREGDRRESDTALTATLDPRNPLVLDTHELSRRPGSMKRVSFSVPAPAPVGIDVLRVPEGGEVALDLRLESVVEGILVTGTASAPVEGECVRCLDPLHEEMVVDFQELYLYEGSDRADDDADLFELSGDLLDLDPVLRNAIVLALPLRPLCREDCPGLCGNCGARMADDPSHAHDVVDSRWAALVDMLGPDNDMPSRSATSQADSTSSPQAPAPQER